MFWRTTTICSLPAIGFLISTLHKDPDFTLLGIIYFSCLKGKKCSDSIYNRASYITCFHQYNGGKSGTRLDWAEISRVSVSFHCQVDTVC